MRCAYCKEGGSMMPYYTETADSPDKITWLHQGRCSVPWHEDWRARGMAYEHKDNSGSLFRNDRKEKDTHPDYQGSAKIDGVDYWISGWLNEKNGTKFFGFKFKRKDDQPPADSGEPFDDSVPF